MASKFNQDLASEVRVQKVGNYTITPIGGPAEYALWKQKQLAKQKAWEEQAEARYFLKKANAIAVLTGDKAPTPDYAEEIQRKFKEGQERQAALYAKDLERRANTPSPKASSIFDRLLNWFINLKV